MRKISRRHQEIINQALAYEIDLNSLREKYKLHFVLKLFNYLQKETKKQKKLIDPLFPNNYFNLKITNQDYINALEDAGFKLKKKSEDFIDEDTGDIVTIERFKFKPIK